MFPPRQQLVFQTKLGYNRPYKSEMNMTRFISQGPHELKKPKQSTNNKINHFELQPACFH